jgi:hydroxymethylpyrimidine pyrophosphatase-like HAD family hydrolase
MRNKLTDPYLIDLNGVKRLVNEWVKHKSLVIAYDYDNTVFDYHNIGYNFENTIKTLRECKEYGAKFIVFSCSPKDRHPEMINYLNDNDIPWDTINENIVKLHGGEGKVFYNILLDDRAGLKSAYSILNMALTVMQANPANEDEACKILSKIYGKRVTC